MKKCIAALILCLLFVSPALAQTRVFDHADVVSDKDEQMLEEQIASMQGEYPFDVVILTEESLRGQSLYNYSETFYDTGSFGEDGILLLLVTGGGAGNRDYDICTAGKGRKIFGESAMEALDDAMLPYLRRSEYASGISQFVRAVSSRLNAYQPLNRALRVLPVALLIGLAVGLIVASVFRHQMKTVRRKTDAASYIRQEKSGITRREDVYLYTTTTTHRVSTSSGSRSGGGGHSHAGGGGHTHHSGKF
ncbi:MAG: TPM domain-containing protein [Clostridia bacterium]|nr:TPM domain-containing protein [Clostridia bacterium]